MPSFASRLTVPELTDLVAYLVSLRVLGDDGSGTVSNVIEAIDWAIDHQKQYSIGVLNLSLGTTQRSSYHEDLLAALAEAAWFSGIAVVAAAGNDGPVPGTVATPGADPAPPSLDLR